MSNHSSKNPTSDKGVVVNKHVTIAVSKIHPNPHRDFKTNPIRQEQVDKIADSIGRTGFWDNVVVRPHPEKKGEYQLAYGHNRLEAIIRADIKEVTLPVRDLSSWEMFTCMVDENESQETITPRVAFENVRVGLRLIEKAFRKIGEGGTEEQFNKALERTCVTHVTHVLTSKNDGTFERTRKAFFLGEGVGRKFLADILPGHLDSNIISDVLSSIYGKARAEGKVAKAAKVENKAKQHRQKANKATGPQGTKKYSEAAERAEKKAADLRSQAKEIGEGSVDEEILLKFENTYQMRMFCAAIKNIGVKKQFHQAAFDHIQSTGITAGRQMEEALAKWWYQASGQADQDVATYQREQAAERFRKKVKDGDFQQFLSQLVSEGKQWVKNIKIALDAAPYYDNRVHRQSSHETLQNIHSRLGQLVDALSGEPQIFQDSLANGSVNKKLLVVKEEAS